MAFHPNGGNPNTNINSQSQGPSWLDGRHQVRHDMPFDPAISRGGNGPPPSDYIGQQQPSFAASRRFMMRNNGGGYQGDLKEPVMAFDPKTGNQRLMRPPPIAPPPPFQEQEPQHRRRVPGEINGNAPPQEWARPMDGRGPQPSSTRGYDPLYPRTNEPVNWKHLQQELRRPGDPKDAVLIPDRHAAQMLSVENERPGRPDTYPGRAPPPPNNLRQKQQQQRSPPFNGPQEGMHPPPQQRQHPGGPPPGGDMIMLQETTDLSQKLQMLEREKTAIKNQIDSIHFQLASTSDEKQVNQLQDQLERLRDHIDQLENENMNLQDAAQGLEDELGSLAVISNPQDNDFVYSLRQDLQMMQSGMSELEQENLRLRHNVEELQYRIVTSNNFHELRNDVRGMLKDELRFAMNRLQDDEDVFEPEIIEDNREFTNLPSDWGGRYRRKKHPISTNTKQDLMKKGGMENSELQAEWKDVHTMPAPYFGRPVLDPFKTHKKRKLGKFQAVTGPGAFGNDSWHEVSDRWSGMSKRHGPHYTYRNDG